MATILEVWRRNQKFNSINHRYLPYLTNSCTKLHPDSIWNDRALGFVEEHPSPNKKRLAATWITFLAKNFHPICLIDQLNSKSVLSLTQAAVIVADPTFDPVVLDRHVTSHWSFATMFKASWVCHWPCRRVRVVQVFELIDVIVSIVSCNACLNLPCSHVITRLCYRCQKRPIWLAKNSCCDNS